MPTRRVCRALTCAAMASLAPAALAGAADHPEVLIGQSSNGAIVATADFTMPVTLPVNIFPGISGWSGSVPGFACRTLDDAAGDVFVLDKAVDIEFIVTAIDPGLGLLNDHGSAFMTVGETFHLGQPFFDDHPLWNVASGTPGHPFNATIVLRDRAHILADSDPLTLSVTPDSCRGDANLDGHINTLDLGVLLSHFGEPMDEFHPGHEVDMNEDGVINTIDLGIFLSNFGTNC